MQKTIYNLIFFLLAWITFSCSHRPSKVELMRIEKAQKDSIQYVQAKQNLHYSDSLLQAYLPLVDPLLKAFVYSKDEKAEDHGHYVHQRLQTTSNTSRNFLQAYVSDNHLPSLQSYYFGSKPHNQRAVQIQVGEDYISKEGSNHAFNAEGRHEILTIEGKDALQILSFIHSHADARIRVSSIGEQNIVYYLSDHEKKALASTYELAILMQNIDALERAIHVADLQIQKYEKKHIISK